MSVEKISGHHSANPLPVERAKSLLIRALRRADNVGAIIVLGSSQLSAKLGEGSAQTLNTAITCLRACVPPLPAFREKVRHWADWLVGVPTADDIADYLVIPVALNCLNNDQAQGLLGKLLKPVSAPGDKFNVRLAEFFARYSATCGAIARTSAKDLPLHLEVDEEVLSSLLAMIRPAAIAANPDENAFRAACRAWLLDLVPGTAGLTHLLSATLAQQVSSHTNLLAPLFAGKTPEQCLAVRAADPAPLPPAEPAERQGSDMPEAAAAPPQFMPSATKEVGFPDPEFYVHGYTGLKGAVLNAPTTGGGGNAVAKAVVVAAGSSRSFIRSATHNDIPQCVPQAQPQNGTAAESYPGGGSASTHFGVDAQGNHYFETQVTADREPLLFIGVDSAVPGGMKIINNLLEPGDRMAVLPSTARQDTQAMMRSASPADPLPADAIPLGKIAADHRLPAPETPLSWLVSKVMAADKILSDTLLRYLTRGVAAETTLSDVPDADQIIKEMEAAWRAQGYTDETESTTAALAQPEILFDPFTFTQHPNGSIAFDHHGELNLDDYALRAIPLNGTQSTPLRADQRSACYNIKTPGAAGSKVYNVTRQPFRVGKTLPFAMTGPGVDPVELVRVPVAPGKPARFSVAPQDPQLLQFLAQFYVARGPMKGSITLGGDGLIRGQGNNMWCQINGKPFPVREGEKGQYFIPVPSIDYLVRGDSDPAAARRRFDELNLQPIEVANTPTGWTMKPTDANRASFMAFVVPTGLFGITTASGIPSAHGFRYGNVIIPYEENVPTIAGYVTLPAMTDATGVRPPVPVDWHLSAGFGGETGFYAVHASEQDVNAIRSPLTLDNRSRRQKAAMVFKFLGLALSSPLRSVYELYRDAMGDVTSRRKVLQAIDNNGWQEDNEVSTAVTSLLDFAWNSGFSSNVGYYLTTTLMQGILTGIAKILNDEPISREEAAPLMATVVIMRANMKIPTVSGRGIYNGMKRKDILPGLQLLEKAFIEEKLEQTPDPVYRNLYRHKLTGTAWLHNAEAVAGQPDYPVQLTRRGDLYAWKMPGEITDAKPEFYLSVSGELRLMSKEEADLSAFLQPQAGEEAPSNLYQDPRTGWQYVRLTDEAGIRTGHKAVARNGEYYEVPGSDEVFTTENGQLRMLTPAEYLTRESKLPRAEQLNGHYQKVYVIERDRTRTVAYERVVSSDSAGAQNGRNTYRYIGNGGFKATGKVIDANGELISLPGGADDPVRRLQWQNIKQKLQQFATEKAGKKRRFDINGFIDRHSELELQRFIDAETGELTLEGHQVNEQEFNEINNADDVDVHNYLQHKSDKAIDYSDVTFWAYTHRFHIRDFVQKVEQYNPSLKIKRVSPATIRAAEHPEVGASPNIDIDRVNLLPNVKLQRLDSRPPVFPKLNNYGPIIWADGEPNVSKTLESEGIIEGNNGKTVAEQINEVEIGITHKMEESIIRESETRKLIERKQPLRIRKEIVARMTKTVREMLANEQLVGERIERLLTLDYNAQSGWGVYAKVDIKANEVIGFYRGEKLTDMQLYQQGVAKGGTLEDHIRVQSYLFDTNDDYNLSPVDGGNWLCLVNSSDLPVGVQLEENVVSSVAHKNLIIYVSVKDIPQGTQLALPYGAEYDFKDVAWWRENMQRKIEGKPPLKRPKSSIPVKKAKPNKKPRWQK